MSKHCRWTLGGVLVATCTLSACSGGNEVADVTLAVPVTAPSAQNTVDATVAETTPEPTIQTTVDDTATTSITEATVDTSVDTGLTGPMFSDALGVKVDGAPGVHTQGDTRQLLDEGLYVHIAWEPDPDDPSVFTVQPDDIAILEAYANAVAAFYKAATTDLIVDPSAFGPYMVDAGAQFDVSLRAARAGGFVNSLGAGVVLRPYVLADRRSEGSAVVLDCTVSDEAFVLRAAPKRPPTEPVQRGQLATMVLSDGEWKAEAFSEETAACL